MKWKKKKKKTTFKQLQAHSLPLPAFPFFFFFFSLNQSSKEDLCIYWKKKNLAETNTSVLKIVLKFTVYHKHHDKMITLKYQILKIN